MPSKKLLKPLFASLLMGATLFSLNSDANSATRTEVKKMVIEEASISSVPAALAMAVAKVESDFQYRIFIFNDFHIFNFSVDSPFWINFARYFNFIRRSV